MVTGTMREDWLNVFYFIGFFIQFNDLVENGKHISNYIGSFWFGERQGFGHFVDDNISAKSFIFIDYNDNNVYQ
jgi:hypothetical protein